MRLSDRDPDELLRPGEAADILGVTRDTLTRWANTGRIECVMTVGGHHRYRVSDLLAAYVEANAPI